MRPPLIFCLTRKLASKLGVEPAPSLPQVGNPLCNWTAHLFEASRVQYILVTNSATLYSCVITGGKYRRTLTFLNAFTEELARFWRGMG